MAMLLHALALVEPVEHDEPGGQTLQSVSCCKLGSLLYRPPGHGSSADAPSGQKLPPPQTKHAVAPLALMNVPASQFLHVGCRCWSLNVPGAHGVAAADPTEQNVPSGQITHCSSLVIGS